MSEDELKVIAEQIKAFNLKADKNDAKIKRKLKDQKRITKWNQ